MTCIVCTRKGMAADRQTVYSLNFKSPKLVQYKSSIFGFSGDAEKQGQFMRWIGGGEQPIWPSDSDFAALELTDSGEIWLHLADLEPQIVENDFYGIGSGSQIAIGAMEKGADMREAIRIASKWDSNTSAEVQLVML